MKYRQRRALTQRQIDALYVIGTVLCFAGIGVMLAL